MSNQPYISRHFGRKDSGEPSLNLSLYIDDENFVFALLDQHLKQVQSLHHVRYNESMQHSQSLSERLLFLINNYSLAGKSWKHVNIAILNTSYTLLPLAFDKKENVKELLQFNTGEASSYSSGHRFNNMALNYVPDAEVHQILERNFRNAEIRHAGAVNIYQLFNNRSLKNCDLLININEGIFELLAKRNQDLLYYNVFEYETKEDVLYYVLFMADQFGLEPEKLKVALAGQIEAGGELHSFMKKYLPQLSFAVNGVQSPAENGFPEHFYFTLLNQHLCEL